MLDQDKLLLWEQILKNTKVSIVVLNFNGKKYLETTLPGIMKLDYNNLEVIVVDNGSSDGSIEYIRSFNNIRLLQSPRFKEKNFACNFAISKATGEYILLLDNDALIEDASLIKKLLNFYRKLNNPGFVSISLVEKEYSKSGYYGGFFCSTFINYNKKINNEDLKKLNGIEIGFPHGANLFFHIDLWGQIGGYDNDLIYSGDDTDIGIKAILYGYKNYLFSESSNIHLGVNNSKSDDVFIFKWKNMIYSHLSNIFVNYKFKNLCFSLLCFSGFVFLKTLKQAIQRKNIFIISTFFFGHYTFIKNIKLVIRKRKAVQSKRVVKDDIFLKIKAPKIVS
jgi:hypothetical protein